MIATGVKPETAKTIIDHVIELSEEIDGQKKQIAGLTEQRDELRRWKAEMLEVERWWNKIDEYVRGQQDAVLGRSVAVTALDMLKERRELLNYIDGLNAIRNGWQDGSR